MKFRVAIVITAFTLFACDKFNGEGNPIAKTLRIAQPLQMQPLLPSSPKSGFRQYSILTDVAGKTIEDARFYDGRALDAYGDGRFRDAEIQYLNSIKINAAIKGIDSIETADAVHRLVQVYESISLFSYLDPLEKKPNEVQKRAEALLLKIISTYSAKLGPTSEKAKAAYGSLASILDDMGRKSEATQMLKLSNNASAGYNEIAQLPTKEEPVLNTGQTKLIATIPLAVKVTNVDSLCQASERVIFSCSIGQKLVSICGSTEPTPTSGYAQYRFGIKDAPELTLPMPPTEYRSFVKGAMLTFSGGGGAYLRFANGEFSYVTYTAIGKGWGTKEGLVVERKGKSITNFPCVGPVQSEIGPELFLRAGILEDQIGFDLP
jgi:hypothetical protein